MGELFREQRKRHDYFDEPEGSVIALEATITSILKSDLSPEDQEAQIADAKTVALEFGLDTGHMDRIHQGVKTYLNRERG
jgi:hypothetical protein